MMKVVAVIPITLYLVTVLEGFLTCPEEEHMVSVPTATTAVLPCFFRPSLRFSVRLLRVSWQKEHEVEDLVVHFQNGNDTGDKQNELFKGRTTMSKNWFVEGNATLTLEHVRKKDGGKYTCWVTVYPIQPGLQSKCCVVVLDISDQQNMKMTISPECVLPGCAEGGVWGVPLSSCLCPPEDSCPACQVSTQACHILSWGSTISCVCQGQGNDHYHAVWERALAACLFLLVLVLFIYIPYFLFSRQYSGPYAIL